ncbi:MAG: ImmA/IrrE family metallo-endopeptidase [Hyphomicrobiaceae bacterium]
MTTKTAGTAAAAILKAFRVTAPPVLVDEIIAAKRIALRFTPLAPDLSGMIFQKDGEPVIVVNSTHPPNRQRFTMAHELGHHELHLPAIGSSVHVDKKFAMARDLMSASGLDRQEIEANRFAAELLVPRTFLSRELQGRVVDIEDEELVADLARLFRVSRQMMAIRIGDVEASDGPRS